MKFNRIDIFNICGLIFAVTVSQFWAPLVAVADTSTKTTQNAATTDRAAGKVKPMSDERFWAIVEASTKFESDPKRQLLSLHSELAKLSVDDLLAYEAAFDGLMRRSYTWDLWGAAYVIHGGASDDGFEYFRCWLISKGRTRFEKALADPDSLADMLAPDVEEALDFESFAYVARKVWAEKTGRKGSEMPNAAQMIYAGHAPSGVAFTEDPAALDKRYPKLWKRFGEHPLL
jgi:hypothetical protein